MEGSEYMDKAAGQCCILFATYVLGQLIWECDLQRILIKQEVKGAKKFRHAGIEPALKLKYDRMYSNIAPSSGVQGGGNCFQPDTNDANIDAVDLEEGSGDLEEDINHASDNDIAHNRNTQKNGKRKEEAKEGRTKKKKTIGIEVQLMSKWDQLLDNISTRSDSTSMHMDHEGCSIHEVMAELHSIPGISVDDEFHDFASEFLLQRRRREMWTTMGSLEEKLK
uniref:Uncharacterized protein n=1 Tax=Salix viminalis TaxID=40686 RepID=A0A6N2KAF3_SALVM